MCVVGPPRTERSGVLCNFSQLTSFCCILGWEGSIVFLALAHMLDATQLVWGGDDNVPCTCTHVGCYATGLGWGGITFLALTHMLDATQLVWGVGGITFLARAHMLEKLVKQHALFRAPIILLNQQDT